MGFPAFFAQAPVLRLHDGLSQLLGSTADGVVEYGYADAVRLAGHSCPTVAGTWLGARAGLAALYGADLPERGRIAVALAEAEDSGVAGVVGQVLGLVTGAAGRGGFKGLAGLHARNGLLRFGEPGISGWQLRRLDTGHTVEVTLDTSPVPADPQQHRLLQQVIHGQADAPARARFAELWQQRVRRMLLEHADDPAVVQVRRIR